MATSPTNPFNIPVNNGNPFLEEDESSATTTMTMTTIEVVDISANNIEVATESIRLVEEPEQSAVSQRRTWPSRG